MLGYDIDDVQDMLVAIEMATRILDNVEGKALKITHANLNKVASFLDGLIEEGYFD